MAQINLCTYEFVSCWITFFSFCITYTLTHYHTHTHTLPYIHKDVSTDKQKKAKSYILHFFFRSIRRKQHYSISFFLFANKKTWIKITAKFLLLSTVNLNGFSQERRKIVITIKHIWIVMKHIFLKKKRVNIIEKFLVIEILDLNLKEWWPCSNAVKCAACIRESDKPDK